MNTHVAPQISDVKTRSRAKKTWNLLRKNGTIFSLLGFVCFPVLLVAFYYAFLASGQYRSETLFAVRGTTTSPLSFLGLSALPGANVQSGDAYIVADYIQSKQVLIDALEKNDVDLRNFYSKRDIDFAYRIRPDLSLDEFINYWNWMIAVEFNSTPGITTFRVNAL